MQRKNQITNTLYAEHTDDPSTWASPRPAFDVGKFQDALSRRGGLVGSVDRFRLRWAGEHDEYMLENFDVLTGYTFRDENGHEQFVSCNDTEFEFPDGCVPAPRFEETKCFIPRWVIEEYRDGMYHKFWTVQELKKLGVMHGRVDLISYYREPSEVDLETIEAYVASAATLNADDVRNMVMAGEALEERRKAHDREEFVNTIAEDCEKAFKDGIANPTKFAPAVTNFNIKTFSDRLVKEHNEKI